MAGPGRGRRARGSLVLLLLVPAAFPREARARDALREVEADFRRAIERVTPATVVCRAEHPDLVAEEGQAGVSSGVIIHPDGYVLSDADAGAVSPKGGGEPRFADEIEIRVPDLEKGGFSAYTAKVLSRLRDLDSSLLKVEDPPTGGFKATIAPATSDHLRVGDFLFAVGNAFGLSNEAPPTLTAGLVSALAALAPDDGGGRFAAIYTSAAINPGVNGGPVVDLEGRLVGTVSTFLAPLPDEPCQFLGKVVPIDRIAAAHPRLPGAALFVAPETAPARAREAAALERVFHETARRSFPAVVSIEVERSQPLSSAFPAATPRGVQVVQTPRWLGPVSGVLLDAEGWVVTSLYNLTNVSTLVEPGWQAPPEHQVETGLRAIGEAAVHLPTGGRAPARVVAHDGRLGLVLFKADLGRILGAGPAAVAAPTPLAPAPPESYAEGRIVLALGNPFGASPHADPLLTVGILSKSHAPDVPEPWRGQWQTDAGATDANCGGAVVDLRGRLVGMLQIWSPPRHGRNSGIGFVVGYDQIASALPALKEGRSLVRGVLGVSLDPAAEGVLIQAVVPDSPAARAGLRPGDRIRSVGGVEVADLQRFRGLLLSRWAGDRVRLEIGRDGEEIQVEVELAPG